MEAESTAFVVANHLNIDTKDYSIGYLNSWGFDKISDEQLDFIDKEELNHYIHAKKYVQTLTEEEVKNLCFEVKDLYEDVLKEFEIKL